MYEIELLVASDPEYGNLLGREVDPLVNWRVTAHRGDTLVHVMASDHTFTQFAVGVHDRQTFEEALEKELNLRVPQRTTERAGLKTLIDETWSSMLEREKAIREEANTNRKIANAVANEREIWQERLSRRKVILPQPR